MSVDRYRQDGTTLGPGTTFSTDRCSLAGGILRSAGTQHADKTTAEEKRRHLKIRLTATKAIADYAEDC